jgi:hypothetical protein
MCIKRQRLIGGDPFSQNGAKARNSLTQPCCIRPTVSLPQINAKHVALLTVEILKRHERAANFKANIFSFEALPARSSNELPMTRPVSLTPFSEKLRFEDRRLRLS